MKRNTKGFTLGELLIVVAIIAVLVAIALPTFNKQLEQSKEKADIANMRNAYNLMDAYVSSKSKIDGMLASKYTHENPLYYTLDGNLSIHVPNAYGQGTSVDGNNKYAFPDNIANNINYYDSSIDYTGKIIICWTSTNGNINVSWIDKEGAKDSTASDDNNNSNESSDGTIKIGGVDFPFHIIPIDTSYTETTEAYYYHAGHVYQYKNEYYIALGDNNVDYYTNLFPGSDGARFLFVKLTNKTIDNSYFSNGQITKDINRGDVYTLDGYVYVCKYNLKAGDWRQTPDKDSNGNWQVIK